MANKFKILHRYNNKFTGLRRNNDGVKLQVCMSARVCLRIPGSNPSVQTQPSFTNAGSFFLPVVANALFPF